MDFMIRGKRALVSGGSAGIGRAIAHELAREGCRVALVARTVDRLESAARAIAADTGARVSALPADLSNPEAVRWTLDHAIAEMGGVDILVNNAGSAPEDGLGAIDYDKWRAAIDLKVWGYTRLIEGVLPGMREQRWGRIVNIIGRSGHQPRPTYLAGGSINAGLLNITKAMADACAKDNVLINGVNPGATETERWDGLRRHTMAAENITAVQFDARAAAAIPLGRVAAPEEIAAVTAFLCSERASYMCGEIVNVDGGSTRCI